MPVPWAPTKYYDNESLQRYDQKIRDICKEESIPYIDVNQNLSVKNWEDGLHPDPADHQKMFEKVLIELDEK